MVVNPKQMQPTVTAIGKYDSIGVVLNTNDAIDILVVVAGQYGVGRRIQLIQRTGCDLQHGWKRCARPVVLEGIEFLEKNRKKGLVVFRNNRESRNFLCQKTRVKRTLGTGKAHSENGIEFG